MKRFLRTFRRLEVRCRPIAFPGIDGIFHLIDVDGTGVDVIEWYQGKELKHSWFAYELLDKVPYEKSQLCNGIREPARTLYDILFELEDELQWDIRVNNLGK